MIAKTLRCKRDVGRGFIPRMVGVVFLLLSCTDSSDNSGSVLIAAQPPSLERGETLTATITAGESFFDGDLDAPITSAGGLILEGFTVDSGKRAVATLRSQDNTALGAHRIEIEQKGRLGILDITVLAPQPGPGSIAVDQNTATAGARHALLTVLGTGTKFDADCEVTVEGADGFSVDSTDVKTDRRIIVTYSIALDQAPGAATLVVNDGMKRYEAPFEILAPKQLANEITGQALTKGRVDWITLVHSQAEMGQLTRFAEIDESVESGAADVTDQTGVRIPVRVPFEYAAESITLTAETFSQGGAFYESVTTDVALLEPAYVATQPTHLELSADPQQVALVTQGIDVTGLQDLTAGDDAEIDVAEWSATQTDAGVGTADIIVGADAGPGPHLLIADDGQREVVGAVGVLATAGDEIFTSADEVKAGDHVYLTVLAKLDAPLAEGDYTLADADGVAVKSITHIDQAGFIAELAVDKATTEGLRTLRLSVGDERYSVYIKVTESGL